MTAETLSEIQRNTRISRGLDCIDTSANYDALIDALIERAELDLYMEIDRKNENNELVTKEDLISAIEFLYHQDYTILKSTLQYSRCHIAIILYA